MRGTNRHAITNISFSHIAPLLRRENFICYEGRTGEEVGEKLVVLVVSGLRGAIG